MGSGASSANLAIQEYESRQGQKLQEDEKNAIRQFSTEGKSNEILRSEFERLKLDNSISPKLRHFIEYQIEKIAADIANYAIQKAADIHQRNERLKVLRRQNPPSLHKLSKLHSASRVCKNDYSSKCDEGEDVQFAKK